jgi:diaminopimelate epimerase
LHVAKMHGAGNDFVVVTGEPPADDRALVRALADRRLGIGADGVLFLEPVEGFDFRMHFYNCDGERAGLCLNGARCAAFRAVQLGWAGPGVRMRTEYTVVDAEVEASGDRATVRLNLPLPDADARSVQLPEGSPATSGFAVHTGDPHLVVRTAVEGAFEERARPLRWWTGPDPAGSNVHFVEEEGDEWIIRSFERGIEGETLACGSGCVSALLALRGREEGSRAVLRTRTGDRIEVGVAGGQLAMTGPAVCVFTTDWSGDGSA